MLRGGVGKFTPDEWVSGDIPSRRPASLVYHALETINFYASDLTDEEFPWGQRFGVDWETDQLERLPSQEQIAIYLKEAEQNLINWLEQVEIDSPEMIYKWTGRTKLERVLYSLRHTQHHVGELSRGLESIGKSGIEWR